MHKMKNKNVYLHMFLRMHSDISDYCDRKNIKNGFITRLYNDLTYLIVAPIYKQFFSKHLCIKNKFLKNQDLSGYYTGALKYNIFLNKNFFFF